MKRTALILLIFTIVISFSCKKDCPDKQYLTNIALANNTGYDIDVQLFPKMKFLISDVFFSSGDVGGGAYYKEFSMDGGFISMHSFKHVLYTSQDTTWRPNHLLTHVFDSIYLKVYDSTNTEILFFPDTVINVSKNPFQDQTIWSYKLIDSSTPDNDCENPSEIHSFRFYIEKE